MTSPLSVQATEFTEAEQLPGPLPDTSFFTFALDLQPDGTNFALPVTVRLQNSRGFAAGTPVPVGLYDFDTGTWSHETMAEVSPDGQWVTLQVTHFSTRDLNFPLFTDPNELSPLLPQVIPLPPPIVGPNCPIRVGSAACPDTGDLGLEHTLPFLRTLGTSRVPVLSYHAVTAGPDRLIGADYTLSTADATGAPGTTVPEATSVSLQIEGQQVDAVFTGEAGEHRYAFFWDGRNGRGEEVPTGIYPYTIGLANEYDLTYGTADYFGGPAIADTGVSTGDRAPLSQDVSGRVIVITAIDNLLKGASGQAVQNMNLCFSFPEEEGLKTW